MSSSFDPYHQWLGIRDPQRPPNLYRLLGIDLFESDADVIETAADRQMAHLRTFQNGPQGDVSQRLLNEVAAAKVCLLAAEKKSAYDAQLRAQQPPEEPPVAHGELVDEADLAVVVKHDRLALRPPERGPRAERPWYVSMVFLLPLLAVVLVPGRLPYLSRSFCRIGLRTAVVAADRCGSDRRRPIPDTRRRPDAETDSAEDAEDGADERRTRRGSGVTDVEPADSAPVDDPCARPPRRPRGRDRDSTVALGHSGAGPPTRRTPPTRLLAGMPPRWRSPVSRLVSPPANRWGPFCLALSQRDLSAAESALAGAAR